MLANLPIHASVAASDLPRARTWFETHLGLTPKMEADEYLWYELGGSTWLSVYLTSTAGTAQNTQAGWTVPDIEAVMADLRSRGVAFENYDLGNGMVTVDGLLSMGPYKACWFKDSEGNTFEISQVDRPADG